MYMRLLKLRKRHPYNEAIEGVNELFRELKIANSAL